MSDADRSRAKDATPLREVFDDLVRFETMFWAAIDERLRAGCGLTLASLNVMMILEATPECRVQDIAQALAITVGGASQAVDRVEKSGWCLRQANPADRRSSILELTDEGTELLSRAIPIFDAELDRLLAVPLSASSLHRFASTLRTLRQAAADYPE